MLQKSLDNYEYWLTLQRTWVNTQTPYINSQLTITKVLHAKMPSSDILWHQSHTCLQRKTITHRNKSKKLNDRDNTSFFMFTFVLKSCLEEANISQFLHKFDSPSLYIWNNWLVFACNWNTTSNMVITVQLIT